MPVKRTRVNLSLPPYLLKKLRETGRQNHLQSTDGSLQNASICTDLIEFVCSLQSDDDVQKHLDENGGILLDLIRRSLKTHIKNGR